MAHSLSDLPTAAFRLDENGRIVETNEQAAGLVGRPQADLNGVLLRDVLGETGMTEDGREIVIRGRSCLVQRGHATPGETVVLLTDVSSLAGERDAALALARERSGFLGKLSHEIRSALASMIGFAEMLQEGVSESNRELAGVITLSGRHLIDTLNAVMDLARIEFGEEEIQLTEVSVSTRVRERIDIFKHEAALKAIDLSSSCSENEPVYARLNPVFLDRVLHNLIDNAIKYTDAGCVEVDVEERDGKVWIYVADTGRGMHSSFIPRLFAPFEREESPGNADEGIGLGLAVTRHLVELMDGRITACSTVGEGSTFTVTFPALGSRP